jgi:hypothetical protein
VTDQLNILVLHALGDPEFAPAFLKSHVFALQNCCPEHNYLYHDAALPLPPYVRDAEFDAVLIDVTFLTARWAGESFYRCRREEYAFVSESPAVKIAFPQDEYDCHLTLDEWMCDWRVDVVYSVIPSSWDVLYPQFHSVGEIRLGYTGYIDEALIDRPRKPFAQRRIDIGYRARKLPPYFGKVGENKWTIGRDVLAAASETGLKTDIVLGESGTLFGDAWLDFISDSKFTLGANSGSSLLDPYGGIQRAVKAHLAEHPKATFDEVEAAVFPGLDGLPMTAISPRVLEAALLESGQILVDGDYSSIVQPWEHYIPIRPDASNAREVFDAMKDARAVHGMISRCREAVLSVDDLRYRTKARKVIELVGELKTRKGLGSDSRSIERAIKRYHEEMDGRLTKIWAQQRFKRTAIQKLSRYPSFYSFLRRAKKAVLPGDRR